MCEICFLHLTCPMGDLSPNPTPWVSRKEVSCPIFWVFSDLNDTVLDLELTLLQSQGGHSSKRPLSQYFSGTCCRSFEFSPKWPISLVPLPFLLFITEHWYSSFPQPCQSWWGSVTVASPFPTSSCVCSIQHLQRLRLREKWWLLVCEVPLLLSLEAAEGRHN